MGVTCLGRCLTDVRGSTNVILLPFPFSGGDEATCPLGATTWDMRLAICKWARETQVVLLSSPVLKGTEVHPFLELAWPISTLLGPEPSEGPRKGWWHSQVCLKGPRVWGA